MTRRALTGAKIFDGKHLYEGKVLLLDGTLFRGIVTPDAIPGEYDIEGLDGGIVLPGFVDLQVNGGGGVMFNDHTTVEGLITIAVAHATTGTRALLPTLITDTPARTRAAIDAVETAIAQGVRGIIGVHLEGPHLSIARKGAHDPSLIRRMEDNDEAFLLEAARRLPNVMITVAPENVSLDQIARLSKGGIIVSLGHTDCSGADADAAFAAGARCVTHLFNAMSQMGNREPGLVGATLNADPVSAGLIADDVHVDCTSMRVALSAKHGPGRIFLVTDAMATAGSDAAEFRLNGRKVLRHDNRLTLEDGTLAGAHVDFPKALSVLVEKVGIAPLDAYAMVTSAPAALLSNPGAIGSFIMDEKANAIHLGDDMRYVGPC